MTGNVKAIVEWTCTTIFYAYQGTETMLELPASGAITDYIYAGGLRIAKVSGTTVN
jgi:hypothetical protein